MTPKTLAPSLKPRLVGDASIYKPLVDRDRPKDPNEGVYYFKNELRPHFVKGVDPVFIFKFYQLQMCYRGSQDFQIWMGKLQIIRKRIVDAWMSAFLADPAEHADVQAAILADN